MRILLLSWEFPPHVVGGLGKHVADLAPALAAHGIEVHIVTPNLSSSAEVEEFCPGVTVHRTLIDSILDKHNIVAFSQASNANLESKGRELYATLGGFDLIHGHDWLVAYSSIALKYAFKIPLVVTVRSMEYGRMQGDLSSVQSRAINGTEWWLTYEAWRVITVSRYMATQAHNFFSVPNDKIDVIPNGVMLPQHQPMNADEAAAFRATYARPNEKIVYYVGRIVYEKGVQVLIDAAPRILRQMSNTRFVIAGTGAHLHTLREQAQRYGIADQFVFAGFIDDDIRDKLYQVADLAVFPSLYEPFGIVALEAMAYGCPVVVSRTGGLSEFVRHFETGLLAEPNNVDSLAWAITETLEHPAAAEARAHAALLDAKQSYNWQHIAAQTADTYRRVHEAWRQGSWGRLQPDS